MSGQGAPTGPPGEPWPTLVLTPLPLDVLRRLFGGPGLELVQPAERTQAAVEALLPDVDLVLGDWTHTLRVDDPGPRVVFVQQPSVGVDVIDVGRCAAAGVPVGNCPGVNAVSVAEWCLGATISLLRGIAASDAAVRRGGWPQDELAGRELAGSRVGLVGMGAIGQALVPVLRAMSCEVSYWSRTRRDEVPAAYCGLDALLAGSDVVVVVVALTPQTRHLLDARRLALMPPTSVLVNAARGDVVDESALARALAAGALGGAALDVFSREPLPPESPLRSAPHTLLTPHLAGATSQAVRRIVDRSRANLLRAAGGQPVQDVVNGVDPRVGRPRPAR